MTTTAGTALTAVPSSISTMMRTVIFTVVCATPLFGETQWLTDITDGELAPKDNCPLTEKELEDPTDEQKAEWFTWSCCGEPGDDEGCRTSSHHQPDRGMGY